MTQEFRFLAILASAVPFRLRRVPVAVWNLRNAIPECSDDGVSCSGTSGKIAGDKYLGIFVRELLARTFCKNCLRAKNLKILGLRFSVTNCLIHPYVRLAARKFYHFFVATNFDLCNFYFLESEAIELSLEQLEL